MYESRISTTVNLVRAFEYLKKSRVLFVSMSAVEIYDYLNIHNEDSNNFGNDFLAELYINWEKACRNDKFSNQTVIIRSEIVLANDAGFLKRVYFPFKLGLGIVFGKETQSLPFIHINDFLRGIEFVIDRHLTGIVNFVAPTFCSNLEFSQTLSKKLRRPLWFELPSVLIRFMMGKQSSMLLECQNVKPRKLEDNGFKFTFPNINSTINNLLNIPHT